MMPTQAGVRLSCRSPIPRPPICVQTVTTALLLLANPNRTPPLLMPVTPVTSIREIQRVAGSSLYCRLTTTTPQTYVRDATMTT